MDVSRIEGDDSFSPAIPSCGERKANQSLSVTPMESHGLARDTTSRPYSSPQKVWAKPFIYCLKGS
jgi:hypothetical protein